MGVQLGRSIAFDWPGRVVLEGRGGKLPRRLRCADVADSRLGIPLQLGQSRADALPVRHSYPFVAADQGGEGYRLRRGKRRVPSGPMLDAGYFPAKLAVVGLGRLMPDELRLSLRVLAFTQAGEVLRAHGSRKAPLSGKPALPLAMPLLVAAPVILPTRSELPRVVCPRLACREWLRDR